jgi:hypothetical protein
VCGERWAAAGGKMLDGLEAEAARLALAASLTQGNKRALRSGSGTLQAATMADDHGQGA